jgi:hypothetical protein
MSFKLVFVLTLIQHASAVWFSHTESCDNQGNDKFSLIVSKEGEIPYCIHEIYECNLKNVLDNLFQAKEFIVKNKFKIIKMDKNNPRAGFEIVPGTVYLKGKEPLDTVPGTPEYIRVANLLSLNYYHSSDVKESIGRGFYQGPLGAGSKTIVHVLKPQTAEQLFHQHHRKGSDTPGFRKLIFKN